MAAQVKCITLSARDLAELFEWTAPCGRHSHLAGVYRLLPDPLQQRTAHDGD